MQRCPDKFESYGRIVHRGPVSDEALFYAVWTDTFSESQLEKKNLFLKQNNLLTCCSLNNAV